MRSLLLVPMATTLIIAAMAMVQAVPLQLYGLNYNTRQGPDWDWDKCKSRANIQTDLALLKLLTNRLRILSLTDCDQGNLVLSVAKEIGFQLWLGLWVGPDDFVFEQEKVALQKMIDQGLLSDGTVLGITVGSEAIYRKDATVDEMINNMNEGEYTCLCVCAVSRSCLAQ
jgi:glucan 1,3-beta-glucosidase